MNESQSVSPKHNRWLFLHIALGVIIGLVAIPFVYIAILIIGAFLKGLLGW